MKSINAVKGNVMFSASPEEILTFASSHIIYKNGIIEGIFQELPERYQGIEVLDYGDKIIIPGFVDLHVHAPQFYQRGMGMDMELIEWLEKYTFHQEKRFSDLSHARKAYAHFTDELVKRGTLCACIFATVHKPATELLFSMLSAAGIYAFVGKVEMDRNCPDALKGAPDICLKETEELILKYGKDDRVKPILTPRFVPTCSEELMKGLGRLASKYGVPVQSHLSENKDEVKYVRKLHQNSPGYAHVYNEAGLFGQTPTLMAHCVYLTEQELELLVQNGVVAVHCPDSNLNLASGIMPVRKMIKKGIRVGLGSDVGGGHNLSMNGAIVSAIQMSKVMKVLDPENEPLTLEECFYMATKGGGSFFGKTGSFQAGFRFDAIIVDDASLGEEGLPLKDRLQRFIYIGDDRNITARFVNGRRIG